MLAERDGLLTLRDLGEASGHPDARMGEALRSYAIAVVEKEWPLMAQQKESSEAAAASDVLLRNATRANLGALDRNIVDAALKVRSARAERLALSITFTDEVKWLAVLILAIMTQVALAVVHLDNWRPQATALTIFSVAAVSTIALVAVFEGPFEPPFFVGPEPIRKVLTDVPARYASGEASVAAAPRVDTFRDVAAPLVVSPEKDR